MPQNFEERDWVEVEGGASIPADITIWAAGIRAPSVLAAIDGIAVNYINQASVTKSLRSESDPNIFAIGDAAS